MKTMTMISTVLFATAHAFTPKTNIRAFSRATSALMANPKGTVGDSFVSK
jgi:hypothetical protein